MFDVLLGSVASNLGFLQGLVWAVLRNMVADRLQVGLLAGLLMHRGSTVEGSKGSCGLLHQASA